MVQTPESLGRRARHLSRSGSFALAASPRASKGRRAGGESAFPGCRGHPAAAALLKPFVTRAMKRTMASFRIL
jgi:hypothetical protein